MPRGVDPDGHWRLAEVESRSMKTMTLVPIAAAASLGMLGPGSSPAATNQDPIVQRFVCERSYTNFAWGYQHAGIYVDRAGGVYRFDVQARGYRGTRFVRELLLPVRCGSEALSRSRARRGRRLDLPKSHAGGSEAHGVARITRSAAAVEEKEPTRRKARYWPGLRVTGGRYDPVPGGGGGAAATL
jgi:hypothetical protein